MKRALDSHPEFELLRVLPKWHRRGLGEYSSCVRVDPKEDKTNGFFVACFQRKANANKRPAPSDCDTSDKPKNKKRKKKRKKKGGPVNPQ